jgi:hypothetical protein
MLCYAMLCYAVLCCAVLSQVELVLHNRYAHVLAAPRGPNESVRDSLKELEAIETAVGGGAVRRAQRGVYRGKGVSTACTVNICKVVLLLLPLPPAACVLVCKGMPASSIQHHPSSLLTAPRCMNPFGMFPCDVAYCHMTAFRLATLTFHVIMTAASTGPPHVVMSHDSCDNMEGQYSHVT